MRLNFVHDFEKRYICALFAGYALAAMSEADFVEFCGGGSLPQIKDAVENGANVNSRGEKERTPLMVHPLQAQAWDYIATDSSLPLIDDEGRHVVYSKQ